MQDFSEITLSAWPFNNSVSERNRDGFFFCLPQSSSWLRWILIYVSGKGTDWRHFSPTTSSCEGARCNGDRRYGKDRERQTMKFSSLCVCISLSVWQEHWWSLNSFCKDLWKVVWGLFSYFTLKPPLRCLTDKPALRTWIALKKIGAAVPRTDTDSNLKRTCTAIKVQADNPEHKHFLEILVTVNITLEVLGNIRISLVNSAVREMWCSLAVKQYFTSTVCLGENTGVIKLPRQSCFLRRAGRAQHPNSTAQQHKAILLGTKLEGEIEKQVRSTRNIHFLSLNPCTDQTNHQYGCYLLHCILGVSVPCVQTFTL